MDPAKRALPRNPVTSSTPGLEGGFGVDRGHQRVTAATDIFRTFFLQIVRTQDRDIRTREKWSVPAVCHSMSVASHAVAQ